MLRLVRDTYSTKSTSGKLYINNEFFCYTLEDVARVDGVKIKGETAIPSGMYKLKLSMSSRFKRVMPMLFTEDNQYEIRNKGVSYKGIRIHGGNTHKNTEGCILVAHNRINDDKIYKTAEKDLVEKLEKLLENRSYITIEVTNSNYSK